jgi:hypothetical protein
MGNLRFPIRKQKYPGKIRSDLDLLVAGTLNMGALTNFQENFQHYAPLDLWLAVGETAASVVNGSVLPVNELRKIELYPDRSVLPVDLKKQHFRSDIEYQMTIGTPGTYVPIRGDHLGVTRRCPLLLGWKWRPIGRGGRPDPRERYRVLFAVCTMMALPNVVKERRFRSAQSMIFRT